ncbi:bifunctional phosphoribosylaminoimidazolecarboxamide formyltransferase/IMP cyclohydrolase [Nakamurella endophytica]|uniref:Bifunctional purine biosynthesis protein PurH n=1 Tax=Nakamurella endophytica TaxID=1748367 RepID=A0A917SY50_9ACTN|nr:bifunctional phosphoribosylaminoimidazolecarboxamide formyltransferase/IMP cyclohydrolase [Nakamurella endophytica]GGM02563.1 bifunctional purine biosynthesis protein PurH [Nakamurella endophytica]
MTSTGSASATADEPGTQARRPLRRALLSVSDKTGLLDLARELDAAGVQLVSTGGSARLLADHGIPVQAVEDLTGFPESLGGRVKTLHPAVHAGLLADTRLADHTAQLADLGIAPFDLAVVNLYPFQATVDSGASPDECIEQIDIGGPAMVRSAAKNHPSVAVVVDPDDYGQVRAAVAGGGFTLAQRRALAAKAFAHTAGYDVAVAGWFAAQEAQGSEPAAGAAAAESAGATAAAPRWPAWTGRTYRRLAQLRYGENPHQDAALYGGDRPGLAVAEQLHGKEMSYNNYVDADAAWRAAGDWQDPAVAIIKHANPCGIAVVAGGSDDDIARAHAKALACDPVSAFGGVIATNRTVTRQLAEQIAEVFTEVLLAPAYTDDALAVLTRKKNIRLLRMPAGATPDPVEFRTISGGALAQRRDAIDAPGDRPETWTLACGAPADEATLRDLEFAWRACRSVKSNAILLADDGASVGIGMGQVNRVDSARLAVERAAGRAAGAVAASDAFFPFADGLEILLRAGVRAVVQPGGSVRDPEVVAAAEESGATMYLTGTRHFFH